MACAFLLARTEVKEDRHIDSLGIFVVDRQLALIQRSQRAYLRYILHDLHT
jgi:hypothetical protein